MYYKHITINEREKIVFFTGNWKKAKKIALELNRNQSTIGRKIERNSGKTGYRIIKTQRKSEMFFTPLHLCF